MLDLYEDGAVLIPPGQDVSSAVRGMASLREVAPGFLAIKPSVTMSVNKVIEADDIALVIGEWHLEGEGTEGKVRMSGTYTDVARRQGDGSWKFVIDNPDGVL